MVLLTSATLLVVCSVIQVLTVLVTVFRLGVRLKMRRLWWEDMWAGVAMVSTVAFTILNSIYFQTGQSYLVSMHSDTQ